VIARRSPLAARVDSTRAPVALPRLRLALSICILPHWTTLLALAGIALLTLHRWRQLGAYPPGLDGAQWLAIGRGFHGFGRSTEGAYAPLVPLVATTADSVLGPLPTVRLLAASSVLALSLAVWFAAKSLLGPFWALLVAALVLPASALAEPVFYGGYPQQFALAAGMVMVLCVCRFLASGSVRHLWLAGLAALVTAATHHIYFPLLVLSVIVAVLIWLSARPAGASWFRVRLLATALAPSFALFIAIAVAFMAIGYSAPLAASAQSAVDGWRYATREAPQIWAAILAVGIICLAAAWRTRGDPVWLLPAALIAPFAVLFLFTGQPRLLPPVIIGTALAAGMGARQIAAIGRYGRLATTAAALALAALLAVPADRAATTFAHFYAVLDPSLVAAANAIAADKTPGTVAVRQDRRGWPIGWWFEALLAQPVLVGSDQQWLAFPEERDNARQVDALFASDLDPTTLRNLAKASDVRYLVIPKWDWIGWERWLRDPTYPLTILYDDDQTLVLRLQ
jgi:hypothetical protein